MTALFELPKHTYGWTLIKASLRKKPYGCRRISISVALYLRKWAIPKLRVPSRDIPQADLLDDVLACARIVSRGGIVSYQEIATLLRKTDRQGRYYRRAAEILGLVETVGKNRSRITSFGRRVLVANDEDRRRILSKRVSKLTIFHRILRALQHSGGSMEKNKIEELLHSQTTLATKEMRRRRLTSIVNWLGSLRLVTESEDIVSLRRDEPKV